MLRSIPEISTRGASNDAGGDTRSRHHLSEYMLARRPPCAPGFPRLFCTATPLRLMGASSFAGALVIAGDAYICAWEGTNMHCGGDEIAAPFCSPASSGSGVPSARTGRQSRGALPCAHTYPTERERNDPGIVSRHGVTARRPVAPSFAVCNLLVYAWGAAMVCTLSEKVFHPI